MSVFEKILVNVNAGDLVFLPIAKRAGFAVRSGQAGDEVEFEDTGCYILQIEQDIQAARGSAVYLSPIGAPTTTPSPHRIGTVRFLEDPAGTRAAVDLNI